MEDKEKIKIERQKFQMHKKGYEDISNSINSLNKTLEELLKKIDILINRQ